MRQLFKNIAVKFEEISCRELVARSVCIAAALDPCVKLTRFPIDLVRLMAQTGFKNAFWHYTDPNSRRTTRSPSIETIWSMSPFSVKVIDAVSKDSRLNDTNNTRRGFATPSARMPVDPTPLKIIRTRTQTSGRV